MSRLTMSPSHCGRESSHQQHSYVKADRWFYCWGTFPEGKDNAAGIRGAISRLEQLNDDGTPAPPTQEDAPALPAEQGSTRRGHVLPNYMQQSEHGNLHMLALQAELEELERTDPAVKDAALRLDAATERLASNIHQVYVSKNALNCTISCSGPLPHIHEYRAADVRPEAAKPVSGSKTDAIDTASTL